MSVETSRRATPISGLEMRVLVGELSKFVGYYLSNVHSIGENQVLRLKSPEGEADVVVSPTLGAWTTTRPAHGETTEFTSSVRRHLLRLRLESVQQIGLDRVLVFKFSDGTVTAHLIVELMPPGNVLVTDSEGRVIVALREFKGQNRSISRGRPYVPPPKGRASPEEVDERGLGRILEQDKTLGRALGRGLSLPRRYVDEIVSAVSMAQETPTPLSDEDARRVWEVLERLLAALRNPSPTLIETESGLELMVLTPSRGTVVETSPTMSALMDKAFASTVLASPVQEPAEEDKELKEIEVTVGRLRHQLEQLRKRADALRAAARAAAGAGTTDEAIRLAMSEAGGSKLKQRLDGLASTAAVSSALFDEAKSVEREVARIEGVAGGLQERFERAKNRRQKERDSDGNAPGNKSVRMVDRRPKEWFEKFRWFFTSEGKLAVGGRDAQSNTILVKKHMDSNDVAYHADLFGSPFFILKDGKEQTASEVRQLGQATAAFSSGWKTGLSAADSYWVFPDQVSTSAPSGEYLARGSFAMRGKKNFVTKNPMEVAVGIDAAGRVICGPEEAIMNRSEAYLVLIPNREKSSDTAKKVLAELRKLFGSAVGTTGVDDVMRVLPTGGGKIVRRRDARVGKPSTPIPGPSKESTP